MKGIIQFYILKDGKSYVASGVDIPIVTQADTLDVLAENIKEAVELYFEGEDFEALGFAKQPSVLMNFELPSIVHA
jgi:predicted RNase H-like HicB family nuclease